jgi:hypothetical protein
MAAAILTARPGRALCFRHRTKKSTSLSWPGAFSREGQMTTRPLPSDVESGTRRRPADYLYRAGAAYVRAHIKNNEPERVAKEMFGDDVVTNLVIQRAASSDSGGVCHSMSLRRSSPSRPDSNRKST